MQSAVVNNFSDLYLYCASQAVYIPPQTVGFTFTINTGAFTLDWQAPGSDAPQGGGSGGDVDVTGLLTEAVLAPSPGITYQVSTEAVITGPVEISGTVDVSGSTVDVNGTVDVSAGSITIVGGQGGSTNVATSTPPVELTSGGFTGSNTINVTIPEQALSLIVTASVTNTSGAVSCVITADIGGAQLGAPMTIQSEPLVNGSGVGFFPLDPATGTAVSVKFVTGGAAEVTYTISASTAPLVPIIGNNASQPAFVQGPTAAENTGGALNEASAADLITQGTYANLIANGHGSGGNQYFDKLIQGVVAYNKFQSGGIALPADVSTSHLGNASTLKYRGNINGSAANIIEGLGVNISVTGVYLMYIYGTVSTGESIVFASSHGTILEMGVPQAGWPAFVSFGADGYLIESGTTINIWINTTLGSTLFVVFNCLYVND